MAQRSIEHVKVPDHAISYLPARCADDPMPRGWRYIPFTPYGDIEIACYRAKAHGSIQSKIIWISGFKSSIDTYDDIALHAFRRKGIEIDIIFLPNPGKATGFLNDNRNIVRASLMDSLPSGCIKSGVPHFIFAHSLGARAVLENMLDSDFSDHLYENYAGGFFIAPHFSSPYLGAQPLNAIYSLYCSLYYDQECGEAPLDRIGESLERLRFIDITDIPGSLTTLFNNTGQYQRKFSAPEHTIPTHGQVLYCLQSGKRLLHYMSSCDIPVSALKFPMAMIAGKKDIISSVHSVDRLAKIFCAQNFRSHARHQPFLQSREVRAYIIRTMAEMTSAQENPLVLHAEKETASTYAHADGAPAAV